MSAKWVRAIEQISALRTFCAIRRMHSNSPGEEMAKPQSSVSKPISASAWAIASFSSGK
jgi:hypothetical protein